MVESGADRGVRPFFISFRFVASRWVSIQVFSAIFVDFFAFFAVMSFDFEWAADGKSLFLAHMSREAHPSFTCP